MCKLVNKKTNVQAVLVREEDGKFVLSIDGKEKAYSASTIKRWWRKVEDEQPVKEVKSVEPVKEVKSVEPVKEVKPVEPVKEVKPVEEVKPVAEPEKVEKEVVEQLSIEPYSMVIKKPNTIESIFNNVKLDQPGGELTLFILELCNDMDCTFKETSSYIGVKYNKKTIMEVHTSKRGKVKIVVNSKSLPGSLKADLEKLTTCKLAPASYGWTLDYTIECTNLVSAEATRALTEVIKWGITFRM